MLLDVLWCAHLLSSMVVPRVREFLLHCELLGQVEYVASGGGLMNGEVWLVSTKR